MGANCRSGSKVGRQLDSQVIHKGCPAEQEHHAREEASTLEHGSGQNHRSGSNKGYAEGRVQDVGNVVAGERRLGEDVEQHPLGQVADNWVGGVCHVQRVAVQPVLDADDAGAEERLENHGEGRLAAVHAGVEEADGGGDLPTQDGRNQNPSDIALGAIVKSAPVHRTIYI